MKFKEIIYFKGNPEDLLPALLIIRRHTLENDNKDVVANELTDLILGNKSSVRKDNFIWARLKPTLVTLNLIEDNRKGFIMTSLGYHIIKNIKDSDYDFSKRTLKNNSLHQEFKMKMGKILIDLDKDNSKVLDALDQIQKMPMESVHIVDLMVKLKNLGINPRQKIDKDEVVDSLYAKLENNLLTDKIFNEGSRLRELLKYYDYFDLVIFRKNEVILNKIKLLSLQNVKLLNNITDITTNQFLEALDKAYEQCLKNRSASKKISIGPYVPIIPDTQRIVIYDLGISSESFNEKMKNIPSNFGNKQILLAPSRESQPMSNVIKKGRVLFYYMAIFKKGEN